MFRNRQWQLELCDNYFKIGTWGSESGKRDHILLRDLPGRSSWILIFIIPCLARFSLSYSMFIKNFNFIIPCLSRFSFSQFHVYQDFYFHSSMFIKIIISYSMFIKGKYFCELNIFLIRPPVKAHRTSMTGPLQFLSSWLSVCQINALLHHHIIMHHHFWLFVVQVDRLLAP